MKRIFLIAGALVLLLGPAVPGQAADDYRIAGYVTDWTLDWPPRVGGYISVSGIAVDAEGLVYVSATGSDAGEIQVYDSTGTLLAKLCDTSGSGNGECQYTMGVSIGPDGLIHVSDVMNQRIQKFIKSGSGTSVSFTYDSQFAVPGGPYRSAFSPEKDIYVSVYWGANVSKYSPSGTLLDTFQYSWSTLPLGVAVDSQGYLYMSAHWAPSWPDGDFIDKFDPAGNWAGRFGSHGTGDGQFQAVGGIFIDENDILYAADIENHRIVVFKTDGTFLGWYGKGTVTTGWHEPGSGETALPGTGPGEFGAPVDIAIDKCGNVYVTEDWNDRVQKLSLNNLPKAEAGSDQTIILGESASFDGSASSDPDGPIANYAWTFGDGATATGSSPSHSYAAAGVYTVTLTVTDNVGAKASDTTSVTVITPAAASSELKSEIAALPLPSGTKQSLTSKLNAAIAYLNAGQASEALGSLKAFINFVNAQKGKKIPAATADELIAEATRILNAI